MHDWVAYAGHTLIAGRGRALVEVVPDSPALRRMLQQAEDYAGARPNGVSANDFTRALVAALAMQKFGVAKDATGFSSTRQVFDAFASATPEVWALAILNGQTASAYDEASDDALALRVVRGFASGELLQDTARVHEK